MGGDDDEYFWFPEPAIERIQDFLSSKEAARTTILSKSWHNVWLLRPNLDLLDCLDCFHRLAGGEYEQAILQFLEFADETITRYEELNLKIATFRLKASTDEDYFLELKELIVRALKLGATHLHIIYFNVPDELFESAEYLTLKNCNINPKPIVRYYCSRLQSLTLDSIELQNPDTISHILSSCPLILKLSLYDVSLTKPEYYREYHENFGGYYDNYPTNDYGYITTPHMRLRTLVLKYVYFDTLFLGDMSSKFPFLRDLTLYVSIKKRQEEILISSTSLERLYLRLKNIETYTRLDHPYKRQRVTFHFQSLLKFTYAGSVIPLLSTFESNSRGWESHVSIKRRRKCLTTSWFLRLSDFLKKLRRSRVTLSLHVRSRMSFNYEVGDIQGLPTSEIENLTIDHEHLPSLTFYSLLDGLFRICHPKMITQSVSTCFRVKKKHVEVLGQTLLDGLVMQLGNEEISCISTPTQFMYGLSDLKEASAQIFDKAAVPPTWKDATLDALLFDHLKSAKGRKQQIRFRLNWQSRSLL